MPGLHRETGRSLTPDLRRRLVLATMASAATGAGIYLLVMHVALPGVRERLTPAHVEWLGEAFTEYPLAVLGVIVVCAAVLAAPVFSVFRWVYGPLTQWRDVCSNDRGRE